MHERNFDTSFQNYRIDNALSLWKKWPDSGNIVQEMAKVLAEAAQMGEFEIRLRKEALSITGESKFRRKELVLEHGRIDGHEIIFEIKPLEKRQPEDSRLSVRMGTIKDKSYIVFETPIDKPFGFIRPVDIVSIRV